MKVLKCINCKNSVIVSDTTTGYCGKCNIVLHEDTYLNQKLKLMKDEPQIPIRIRKKHKIIKKHKKFKKKL